MYIFRKKNLVLILFIVLITTTGIAIDLLFQPIVIENLSRYDEDRIAYQHVQKDVSPNLDNSFSALLIIKSKKVYLIQDGYDNPENVSTKKLQFEMENKPLDDPWENKINNKPDYVRITERKIELLKNFGEDFVSKNQQTDDSKRFELNFESLLDIPVDISVEIGRTKMTIGELLSLAKGSTLELNKIAGESVDIYVNEKLLGKGDIVVVNERLGVRINEIVTPKERVQTLA